MATLRLSGQAVSAAQRGDTWRHEGVLPGRRHLTADLLQGGFVDIPPNHSLLPTPQRLLSFCSLSFEARPCVLLCYI